MTRVGAMIRAAVYGNEYCKGIYNVGSKTLEPLFAEYRNDVGGLVKHLTVTDPVFASAYQLLFNIFILTCPCV